MLSIRLELSTLTLLKNKKRWDLYFVIATENPEDPGAVVITVMPQANLIPVRRPSGNRIVFTPEGTGADGLAVLERTMPVDRSVKVRLWLMHSRNSSRRTGDIMGELSLSRQAKTAAEALLSLGNFSPWISFSLSTMEGIARFLSKVEDRKMGWVSLDEYFEPDWKSGGQSRENRLSTGFGTVSWSWKIIK